MGAISAIATAISELVGVGWHLYGLFKEAKKRGWIRDGSDLISQIRGAKTDEERMALARRLFEHDSK